MSGRRRSAPWLSEELRQELADEAARLMAEHGIADYSLAKRKAAERLGIRGGATLPSNGEIHERLAERQRTFEPAAHNDRLGRLRSVAARAMDFLAAFRPKLVGSVLDGTATQSSAIELHVFSDSPEVVAGALESRGFRLRDSQRRYRFGRNEIELIPGFTLLVEDEELEVMVFPERGSGHAPLSPVDGKPMRRASRATVLALGAGTDL
ncbi:MAG TPA: hypothetical protein VKA43_14205 [Gammaproteobacteria bacterium]|nr:hypothetical protein [Gammaproteobacteria bacterium]